MQRSKISLFSGGLLVALAIGLYTQTFTTANFAVGPDSIDPMAYPRVLLYVLMACGVIIALAPSASACAQGDGIPMISSRIVLTSVVLVAYALLVNVLGFVVSSFCASAACAVVMGWRRIPLLLGVNALGMLLFWGFFRFVLKIPLPQGLLF